MPPITRRFRESARAGVALVVVCVAVLGAVVWGRASRVDGAWEGTTGALHLSMTLAEREGHVTGFGAWSHSAERRTGPLTVTGVTTGDRVALRLANGGDFMTFEATIRRRELRGTLHLGGESVMLEMRHP